MLSEVLRGEVLEGVHRLACDRDAVYLVRKRALEQPTEIYRLDPGGSAAVLVASEREVVRGLAFDSQYVYYSAIDRVLRLGKRPGDRPQVLAQGEPQASDLVVWGEHLYWTNPWFGQGTRGRPRGPLDGTVRRMGKTGGPVTTILGDGETLRLLGHDDIALFLATGTEVVAIPKDGGRRRVLHHDERNSVFAGAVHSGNILVTAGGKLLRIGIQSGAVTVLAQAQILLEVAVLGPSLYVARNLAYDRGVVAQTAALLALPADGGEVVEVPGISFTPAKLAAGASAVYVLDAPLLGRPGAPRLLAVHRQQD